MDILDRITLLLGSREQQELTKHLNLNSVAYSEWKSGKSKSYRKYLIEISEFFNVSLDYLVYGKEKSTPTNKLATNEQELLEHYKKLPEKEQIKLLGRVEVLAELAEEERKKSKPAPQSKRSKPADEEPPKTITLHKYKDAASAGKGVELGDGEYEEITVLKTTLTERADIAIRVSGDSMEPKFYDEDIVLVILTPSVDPGDIGIFQITENDGSINGYIKKMGCGKLISLNPKRDDILFEEGMEVLTVGRVIGKLNPDWITD